MRHPYLRLRLLHVVVLVCWPSLAFASLSLDEPAATRSASKPTTQLYVSSEPSGAVVFLDGAVLGYTNDLWPVAGGKHLLRVERAGHVTESRSIEVPVDRITRVSFSLVVDARMQSQPRLPQASTRPTSLPVVSQVSDESRPSNERCSPGALAFARRAELADELRAAVISTVQGDAKATRWSGENDGVRFGVAAKFFPAGAEANRARTAMVELVQMQALADVISSDAVVRAYSESGLTDIEGLRAAIRLAAPKTEIVGDVALIERRAGIESTEDGRLIAVAIASGKTADLKTHLLAGGRLQAVRENYRDVLHARARSLMSTNDWSGALVLWRHLHQQKLVSQSLYLDASRCFAALNRRADALAVLTEAIEAFGPAATADFLEKAGDVALEFHTPDGDSLAERAYKLASLRLME